MIVNEGIVGKVFKWEYFVEDLQRSFGTTTSFVNNDLWYCHLQLPSIGVSIATLC